MGNSSATFTIDLLTPMDKFFASLSEEQVKAASRSEELVTSTAVMVELERGTFPGRSNAVKLISNLSPLAVTNDVEQIVEEYISRLLMPSDPSGDALHLALASFYECEFLVTWNCRHLANANKFDNIARINGILGLAIPKIVTPLELLENDDE